MSRCLAFCIIGTLLAGCATAPEPWAEAGGGPRGYWYHDALHLNTVASPSPQAIENAKHGVWLWPPAERGRPG
jgi:hypothetical protein